MLDQFARLLLAAGVSQSTLSAAFDAMKMQTNMSLDDIEARKSALAQAVTDLSPPIHAAEVHPEKEAV